MEDFIYINGKPVYVDGEYDDYFELVDFSPDGEQVRYIVHKAHCEYSSSGYVTANEYESIFSMR